MATTEPTRKVILVEVKQTFEFHQEARSLIGISEEEQRRRMAVARETVAKLEAIEDETGEDDRAFLRDLDESHPGGLDLGRYYADGPDPA